MLGECKAGGVENFKKVGKLAQHDNYGLYHVTGFMGNTYATNCIYCGKDLRGEVLCQEVFMHSGNTNAIDAIESKV